MARTRFKKVPFNLELAKNITNKEVKGQIVTRDGRKARIICIDRWDKRSPISPSNVIALVKTEDGHEIVCEFMRNGMYYITKDTDLDLHLEVPTYYRDYSNFEPRKWQTCLVRDGEKDLWCIRVYAGRNVVGDMMFFDNEFDDTQIWKHCIPLSKETERLIYTTKSYEELIKELEAESTKNEQQ